MVTEEPVKKFDADALIGSGSADALLSSLRVGSRMQPFFFRGSIDWLQQDYIPLSGSFPVHQYKGLPDILMTDHFNNSWSRDERFTGRAGWTPKRGDEYVLSWINLKGQKGVPLYQGPDTGATSQPGETRGAVTYRSTLLLKVIRSHWEVNRNRNECFD